MYLGTPDDILCFSQTTITTSGGVDAHWTERRPRPFV